MTAKAWTNYAITGGASWPTENGGWWPATGYRYYSFPRLHIIGQDAYYWSSSRHTHNDFARYLTFNYDGNASPSSGHHRSTGLSVRCIERGRK